MKVKKHFRSVLALMLVFMLLPYNAFAAVQFDVNGSDKNDGYYSVISKQDWDIAPGISESEIVLNNGEGTRRQVLHVMEADMNSEYTKVIGSYAEMNTSKYQTATMDKQAGWVEENWGYNVVGAMNTCLSWYSGYPADQVGKPLGFMMVDEEVLWGECEGFPTVLVINKDQDAEGNERPADIPKVEMVEVRSTENLDGWEEQVIPCSSGFIVKDGVNQNSANHSDAAPRSVVGIKADGTVVIMENDGRQAPFSTGMSMYELAEVMIGLGCTYAVNCDGGGSSTWLSQRPGEELEVNNSPSDGGLRPTTQGILFISTAPSDGTFERASVEAEAQYYTPNSEVQFTAKGADFAGGAAEIPAEAKWQLSDESFGTIDQNGLFVSNGKTGEVSAQISYNGEVVGEFAISVVVPDTIQFTPTTLTVPNGKSATFSISAKYGKFDVVSKSDDFKIELGAADMGTLKGYELIATEDASVVGGTIKATLTHDATVTAVMDVVYGKASDVFYDFENGFDDDWYVEQVQKRKNWSKTEKTSHYNIVVDDYAVTSETGMVHEGEGAAAVYCDNTYATLNWASAAMYWANETVRYENVRSIGAWIYFPKDAVSTAVRFVFIGEKDGKEVGVDAYPINFGDSLYFEESGWHYCSVDVSEYDAIKLYQAPEFSKVNNNNRYSGFRIELTAQLNGGSSGEYSWQTTPGVKGQDTFYVDDIIIDYSEACADKEEPIFGDVKYVEPVTSEDKVMNNQRQVATVTTYNEVGFTASVTEDTKMVNATGLDASSAKAYIDGNEVKCSFNGSIIAVDAVELTNGVHTVKFTINDKAGNYASVIRKIDVQAENNDCNIKIVAPEVENNMIFTGSQYWIDVVASEVEKVDEVTTTLDLNNCNTWILDQIKTMPGFTTTYKTDIAKENILYLTIKRTGEVDATGEATLASVPVQTWTWNEDDYPGYYPPAGGDNDLNGNSMYDPYECWQEYVTWNADVIINPLEGKAEFVDGSEEWFSGDKVQVDTEQKVGTWWSASAAFKEHFKDKSSWHLHVAGEAQNLEATCTEPGYEGRVFCEGCACVTEEKLGHTCDSAEGCGAVLDWGTTIDAKGHDWQVVNGKLTCKNGEELFNGVYTDGKTYVDGVVIADGWNDDNTSYYLYGKKLTGTHLIDGKVYTFDDTGIYLKDYYYTGFYDDGENGWMYIDSNVIRKGFVAMQDGTYYFDDRTGYAPVGSFELGGRVYKVEGEKGKVLGAWDTTDKGTRYYYSLRYYKNTWIEVEGAKYYVDNDGYVVKGKKVIQSNGAYLGAYEFDETDGKFIEAITGVAYTMDNKYMCYAIDGKLVRDKLVRDAEGNYYYARPNYYLITWGTTLNEEQTDGLLPPGEYLFGKDGKMIMLNGPQKDQYNDKYLVFYKDGSRVYKEGLYEYEGDYYYVRGNGLLLTWPMHITKTNGLLPAGEYLFGEDGKLQMLNGPQKDQYNDKYLVFYKDGARVYEEGLYEHDGNYYYVRGNGLLLTWAMNVTKTNGLLPAGEYLFGEDGKLQMLNGPQKDQYNDQYLVFYKDGVRVYEEGLYEYDGNYYYVRGNGLLLTWAMNVTKTNGLLPEGEYLFGEDGKLQMLNGPQKDQYNDQYLVFYKDGVRVYEEGLYEYDGNYYYVRGNGLLLTWAMNITKTNGLLPAGEYLFGEDGKLQMLNGPQKDSYNNQYFVFYKDGLRIYEEGLYEHDGNYYYVRGNGLLLTWGMYITKTNDLVPAGVYDFNADGSMVR